MLPKHLVLTTLLLTLSSMTTACSAPYLFSQPGRVATLEAAKTVGEGKRSVGVSGGPSTVYNLDITHVSARYRYGVTDQVELGADANFGVVTNLENAKTQPTTPALWSARLATKWAPEVLQDYVAVIGGVAGGTYAGGQFISPDLGVVLAFQNDYVVPFLSASGYVSIPINAQGVDLSLSEPGDYVVTPQTTWGVTTTAGLRVPIDLDGWRIAPSLGLSSSELTDGNKDESSIAASLGVDLLF